MTTRPYDQHGPSLDSDGAISKQASQPTIQFKGPRRWGCLGPRPSSGLKTWPIEGPKSIELERGGDWVWGEFLAGAKDAGNEKWNDQQKTSIPEVVSSMRESPKTGSFNQNPILFSFPPMPATKRSPYGVAEVGLRASSQLARKQYVS